MIRKDEIIKLLDLRPSGTKGWYTAQKCPFCGAIDKFGVSFDGLYNGKKVSSFNCFSGHCKRKGTLYFLLKYLNRLDLISFEKHIDIFSNLKNSINIDRSIEIDCKMTEKSLPLKYQRLSSHPYLNGRGFNNEHFQFMNIGKSDLDPAIGKDYVIFIIEEDKKCVGWVARNVMSKEEIDQYNEKHKALGDGKYILRWKNQKGVDFEKCLYGIDEITEETKTVILVESVTSKPNIDRILNLYYRNDLKCLATFGKKVSIYQIEKLKLKGIQNVILIFDSTDAVQEMKKYSQMLQEHFHTYVGYIKDVKKDPGNISDEELFEVLENLESPSNFNISKVQKKKLFLC